MPKQITIRGVPKELGERLLRLSRERGTSMNTLILEILQEALEVEDRRERLKRYTTWTKADFEEFQETLRAQRSIDATLWR